MNGEYGKDTSEEETKLYMYVWKDGQNNIQSKKFTLTNNEIQFYTNFFDQKFYIWKYFITQSFFFNFSLSLPSVGEDMKQQLPPSEKANWYNVWFGEQFWQCLVTIVQI